MALKNCYPQKRFMKNQNFFYSIICLSLISSILFLSSCGDDDEDNGFFQDQSISISEYTLTGSTIGSIPNGFDLTIVSGNDEDIFSIDDDQIILEETLDLDNSPTHSLVINACENSDGTNCEDVNVTINITNGATFDDFDFDITTTDVVDFGATDFDYLSDGGTPTHYNFDFILYDGELTDEGIESPFFVYSILLSPGTSNFQEGTFSVLFPQTEAEAEGLFFTDYVEISYDGNNNNSLYITDEDLEEDIFFLAFDGSVEVIDNGGNNYTLNYDLEVVQIDLQAEDIIDDSETTFEFSITQDFNYFVVSDANARTNSSILERRNINLDKLRSLSIQ